MRVHHFDFSILIIPGCFVHEAFLFFAAYSAAVNSVLLTAAIFFHACDDSDYGWRLESIAPCLPFSEYFIVIMLPFVLLYELCDMHHNPLTKTLLLDWSLAWVGVQCLSWPDPWVFVWNFLNVPNFQLALCRISAIFDWVDWGIVDVHSPLHMPLNPVTKHLLFLSSQSARNNANRLSTVSSKLYVVYISLLANCYAWCCWSKTWNLEWK